MPGTIQEILDHQEELTDKFENFDPTFGFAGLPWAGMPEGNAHPCERRAGLSR